MLKCLSLMYTTGSFLGLCDTSYIGRRQDDTLAQHTLVVAGAKEEKGRVAMEMCMFGL